MSGADDDMHAELAAARDTIAQQAREIERLSARLEEEHAAADLRNALTLAATAGTIGSPVTHARLLEMIVETAAHVIAARAAALFILDEETQELVFEVALGAKGDEVRALRVPLGHGIAGLVAVSGQPMAVSDAASDPRLATDIAETIGYVPESVLCMPLYYTDRVIGVIELLDKEGRPSFDAGDMDALTLFANQAAVAVQQSRTHQSLAALVSEMLASVDAPGATRFTASVEATDSFRDSLDLAKLVHEIAGRGERELAACRALLGTFATYLRQRPDAGRELSP